MSKKTNSKKTRLTSTQIKEMAGKFTAKVPDNIHGDSLKALTKARKDRYGHLDVAIKNMKVTLTVHKLREQWDASNKIGKVRMQALGTDKPKQRVAFSPLPPQPQRAKFSFRQGLKHLPCNVA